MTLLSDEQAEGYHATAKTWSDGNPYKARLLALRSGQHRPSQTADRFTDAEQWRVDHYREAAEAKSEPANPF